MGKTNLNEEFFRLIIFPADVGASPLQDVSRSKGPISCTPPCAKMIVVLERKPNLIFALVGIKIYFKIRPHPARNFYSVKFLLSSAIVVIYTRNFRCYNARHWDRAFKSIDS